MNAAGQANFHDIDQADIPRTGISEIDRQHGDLVAAYNRLSTWIRQGHQLAATFDAIVALNEYATNHFSFEENYLCEHHYPSLEIHMAEHRQLVTKLEQLTAQIYDGSDSTEELLGLFQHFISASFEKRVGNGHPETAGQGRAQPGGANP